MLPTAWVAYLEGLSPFTMGVVASLLAGLAAGLGALPVFVLRRVSQRVQDVLLGGAAGLMLGATAFSLALPGLAAAERLHGGAVVPALVMGIGMMLGAFALWGIHQFVPHEHFIKGRDTGADALHLKRVWLFVIAITLHNLPEGLAVGVGFGGGDVANGTALAVAIFLQNLPEGFAVALALLATGQAPGTAVLLALGTGVVETVGGLLGAGVVAVAAPLLPWGMAVAAGAMLFVISHEVIPETHRNGYETPATFSLTAGFAVMLLLDTVLG